MINSDIFYRKKWAFHVLLGESYGQLHLGLQLVAVGLEEFLGLAKWHAET